MAREYEVQNAIQDIASKRQRILNLSIGYTIALFLYLLSPLSNNLSGFGFFVFCGLAPIAIIFFLTQVLSRHYWVENERRLESERRKGKQVLGMPPDRHAFQRELEISRERGQKTIEGYLVGFEVDTGEPIWVSDDDICQHGAVFAKTGVGKTLWLEGLMFQQMARGRASGLTFIDAKRDPGTLADIIIMALMTGRIEDLIVIDPFDPVYSYNFVYTTQRADVKARKVLRCGLPPTSDASTTKHYDRLAADAVYRVVRAMESLGLAWSVRDIAVALSAFTHAYPRIRELLHDQGAKHAMIELGHLAGTYKTAKGSLDSARLTDNLRGIASELHSISNSEAGEMFCVPRADLSLTDAILRGKIIYYMLPRLEEAESAARMVKVFREDLEVSIGEVTSSRIHHLEDPHMVIIDEGASTFGPTWANLFELARKGRFALLFGAQSVGGLMDDTMGLSEQFYERVMANVNLKVIMRLGDNRTAMDMSEWIGKVVTQKKSLSAGITSGVSARELTKNIELNRRSSDSYRDAVTLAEDEADLVSPEELKHEMAAEKGLAWFDKGDGILRKGRALWFNADLPSTWEGRENLVLYETVEADEVGLAEWVDEQILSTEREESEKVANPQYQPPAHVQPQAGSTPSAPKPKANPQNAVADFTALKSKEEEEESPFRVNLFKGFRGQGRSRTTVVPSKKDNNGKQAAKQTEKPAPPEAQAKKSTPKPAKVGGSSFQSIISGPAKKTPESVEKNETENPDQNKEAPTQTQTPENTEASKKGATSKAGKFSLRGRARDVVTPSGN